MRKIGSKILLIHFIFACASIFLTLFISYRTVNSILLEHASSLGTACAEIDVKEIDSWLKAKITLLESIAVQIEKAEPVDEESIQKILENAIKADSSFYSFFVGFEDGRLIDANGWLPPADYNIIERPWYREAIDANGVVFTSAYIDKKKNTRVKAIAMPLHMQGKNVVLAANIPFDAIRKQIQSIRFGETGYGILMDGDGIVLVHPEKDNEMKPLEVVQKDLYLQIQGNTWMNQKGTAVIQTEKKAKLLVQVPIKSNDWKLLLLAPIEEFQGPAKKMIRQLMTDIAILLGFMIIISYLLGKRLSKPPDKEIEVNEMIDEKDHNGIVTVSEDYIEKTSHNEAPTRKEAHISGTEEVYDIAGQIDEIAVQLEKGIRSFKIKKG